MSNLPEGPQDWQYHHQNYVRLLLKAADRGDRKPDYSAIQTTLDEVERIQGEKQRKILSDFLNHEREAMKNGIELVKPDSVVAQELAYQQRQFNPLSKDERHEQHKRDIAASDEFIGKLAS